MRNDRSRAGMMAVLSTAIAAVVGVVTNIVTDMKGTALAAGAVALILAVAVQAFVAWLLSRSAEPAAHSAVPAHGFGRGAIVPPYGLKPQHLRGRAELVEALVAVLAQPDGQARVISGLGGTGKTALALHLAGEFESLGGQAWWLSARDSASLESGLRDLAGALGIEGAQIEARQHSGQSALELVWARLTEQPSPWLLVIDNADEPELLAADGWRTRDGNGLLRGSGAGTVVVTSRVNNASTWGSQAVVIPLGPLHLDAATDLLTDFGRGRPEDARRIAERLGCLPLALRAVGRYLSSPSGPLQRMSTFADYLREFESAVKVGADSDDRRAAIRTTWEITLDRLVADGHLHARSMMRLIGRLAAAPIPFLMLDSTVLAHSSLFTGDRRRSGGRFSETEQRRVIDALIGYSLLDAAEDNCLVAHPLVVEINLAALRESTDRDAALATAVDLVHRATEGIDVRAEDHSGIWPLLAPHISALTADVKLAEPPQREKYLEAADRIARGLRNSGDFRAAYNIAEEARDVARGHEQDTRCALAVRHTYAYLTDDMGDFRGAEAEYRLLLADQIRLLGERDAETLTTRDHLAFALNRQGRRDEALAEYTEVLENRVAVLGDTAESTLTTRNNLAQVLYGLGRYADAAAHFELVLAERTAELGSDHRRTLNTRNGLALARAALGDIEGAERELRAVLQERERRLGPKHPGTLRTLHDVAELLGRSGRTGEAVELFRRVTKDRADVLGPDHHDTQVSMAKLQKLTA